jgi:hypothetical protein
VYHTSVTGSLPGRCERLEALAECGDSLRRIIAGFEPMLRGRYGLGRWQLNTVLGEADEADLSAALLHRPSSYFAEFDGTEAETTVHRRCQLVLRGHLHRDEARSVQRSRGACIELSAGAVYRPRGVAPGRANAFLPEACAVATGPERAAAGRRRRPGMY